jgi:hypothetical protein
MYCDFVACRKCNETYLLNENIPKCMIGGCSREWTRKYMMEHFTKSFVNGAFKTHREQILIEKERALMPATQIYVERHRQIDTMETEMKELNEQIEILQRRRSGLFNDLFRARYNVNGDLTRDEQSRVSQFVRACPDNDCRGFLSTQWKCGVCDKWTCKDCHEIKGTERDAEHTCDPANVATATMLARDTKPCPSCHTPIHKIDGCDQMWCVMCHTAFSWRTGRVETRIHNPHYYEWLRRQSPDGTIPRNPGDGCGGRGANIDIYDFIRLFRSNNMYSSIIDDSQCQNMYVQLREPVELFRMNQHNRLVEMEPLRVHIDNYESRNRDLRISFMMNKIDETKYKMMLQQREKKRNKSQDLFNVIQIFVNTIDDILMRFYAEYSVGWHEYRDLNSGRNIEGVDEESARMKMVLAMNHLLELDTIVKYVNECFEDISLTYNSVKLHVRKNLAILNSEVIDYL